MKAKKILAGIGAIASAAAGLILAGKSGLGEGLFKSSDTMGNDPADQGDPIETTATEFSAPAEEAVVETPASSGEQEG